MNNDLDTLVQVTATYTFLTGMPPDHSVRVKLIGLAEAIDDAWEEYGTKMSLNFDNMFLPAAVSVFISQQ